MTINVKIVLQPLSILRVYQTDSQFAIYLGLWDYRGENCDYGITPCLKLGLQKSGVALNVGL